VCVHMHTQSFKILKTMYEQLFYLLLSVAVKLDLLN